MSMMEEGVEAFPDAADFLIREQRRTEARALMSLSESPDDGARADQLSRASGEDPSLVFGDLKQREEQYKARLTSQLLNNNAFLRSYIEAHPLADKVSNDDYGQLDATTETMGKLPGYRKFAYNLATGIEHSIGLTAEGLGYLFGVEGTKGAAERMKQKTVRDVSAGPEQEKEFKESEQTISGMVGQGVGGLIGLAPSIVAGGLPGAAIQMGLTGGAEARNRAATAGVDEQTQATAFTTGFAINTILGIAPLHLLTRPAQATGPGVVNWSLAKLKDAGLSGGVFAGFGELQHGFNEWAAKLLYDPKAAYHPDFNRVVSSFILGGMLGVGFNRVKPWVEAGEEIPAGADRTVDQLKAKQAEVDITNLNEALKEASKSATRERSPELFKIFMQQHTDAKIGVSAEAIIKLYGDAAPALDDNKLGWVPNIAEQLTLARETGGDVMIPLADWLAHVDPAVAKELHDDVRVRPKGLTINEGTALEAVPMVEAYHGGPHEFDAFSMEKIGTGEGAQSYGHGLYFAEQKQVAESYKRLGAGWTLSKDRAKMSLAQAKGDREAAVQQLERALEQIKREEAAEKDEVQGSFLRHELDEIQDSIDLIKSGASLDPGNLYRVRIHAEKEQFLDWDRPGSEQHPNVQKALIDQYSRKLGIPATEVDLSKSEGSALYRRLGDMSTRQQISKELAEAGIPGIRYLDQGSRDIFGNLGPLKEELATTKQSLIDIEKGPHDAEYVSLKKDLEQHIKALENDIAKKENPTYNYVIFDEKLIEIVDRNGEAIQAVRQQAGLEPLARRLWSDEQLEKAATALEGRVEEHGPQIKAVVPEGELTKPELDAVTRANEVLERILPDVAKVPARLISFEGKGVQGAFQQYTDRIPTIMYLMDPRKAVHTVRHEAIHFLRREGFFTKEEWDTLRHAAIKEGWIEHYDIGKRYEGENLARMLEESVAERYADWAEGNKHASEPVNKILGKLQDFAIKLVAAVKAALPHNVTVEELFQKIESGEIGRRQGTKPLDKKAFHAAQEEQPAKLRLTPAERKYIEEGLKDDLLDEVPSAKLTEHGLEFSPSEIGFLANWIDMGRALRDRGQRLPPSFYKTTELLNRIEGGPESYKIEGRPQQMDPAAEAAQRDLFAKANAIGMTIPQFQRHMKNIAKLREEDHKAQMARAEAFERKQQTKEWKEAEAKIREEITNDIQFRPDIAVATFFTEGRLYDTIKNQRPKLDASAIDPELAARLPKELLLKRGGINPDDIAPLFGYQTGKEMVSKLVEMNEARGAMEFKEFVKAIVDDEVANRMLREHGMLEENILKAAQDHVIDSKTQMDILHEEFVGLGMKSKLMAAPFTKDQVKAAVLHHFEQLPMSVVSMDKYLRDAGKAGREAEMKMLIGKWDEAFQNKQKQYLSMLLAAEAKRLEREQESFDKTAKKFSSRKVEGVVQSYTDYIQSLLSLAGRKVRRTDKEIAESIEAFGTGSLEKFVDTKWNEGRELAVSPAVQQSMVKPFDQMSVAEFREYKEAIDSLAHAGRAEKKIIVGEQELDFDTHKAEIIARVQELDVRELGSKWRYMFDASLVKMEEIVRDLDGRMDAGPLFKAMIVPLAKAKRNEYDILKKLSDTLKSIEGFGKDWKKSLKDTIPNDFLIDPRSKVPYDLSRENMINIMLNFGNRSNIQKFTEGYAGKKQAEVLEARLWQLFDQYATKEDWQFVQKVWDIFEGFRKDSDAMYRRISGVPPKWIEVTPVSTKHGDFTGGYFPILFDRDRSRIEVIEDKSGGGATFGTNFIRATTGAGYTKARTGFTDFISFEGSLEQAAGRMQQVIHDITHREAIMSVGKIIYDPEIRAAIRKHYGPEYSEQLHPWLRDVANHYNASEQSIKAWNSALRRIRSNLIVHALGFNMRVILSPNIGMFNPAQAVRFYSDYGANHDLVMSKSNELPHTMRNMDRDFREKLESLTKKNKWDQFQQKAFEASMWPALQFEQQARMIGFYTKYSRALRKGASEAEAIAEADNAVRTFHGAAGTMDLPAIMRHPNELMKTATVFYGFFNTMYNWQRRIPGDIRAGEYKEAMKNIYGAVLIPAAFGAALFNQGKESDPWWKTVGKALLIQPLSTVPLIREGSNFFLEGYQPRTPAESLMQAVSSIISDVRKYKEGRPVQKPIQHGANVVGLATGLPLGQIGRSAQFGYDVGTGRQRLTPFSQKPFKNMQEWMRGIISGEAKLKP